MAPNTREQFIDVARQLFARKGIEHTTMNDIAAASDRGRRTIYTYFRTKSEIYQAVIEEESTRIINELKSKVEKQATPGDKLRALMEYRIEIAIDQHNGYNLWFKSIFSRDAKRANTVRAMTTGRIYSMIDEIIASGIESGDFIQEQALRLPSMLTVLVRGSDLVIMRGAEKSVIDRWRTECIDFIINAIEVK
jgi:AcrR family transcriptional regulator